MTKDKFDIHQAITDKIVAANRIAHHEPILNRNIAGDYASILSLPNFISLTTAHWLDNQSQVAAVLAAHP